ncbi:hypothetical protein [Corynebacterium epidermidicanis]|nr:hypothetical protein [Corynebacterium epidermidicanis]
MTEPEISLAEQTARAIAQVHRRPVSLRKWEVTSAEGVLRGAKLSALIDAVPAETAISVYSLLAPDLVESSARIFLRSPLQILAKMDVLAGGDGKPVTNVSALQQLAHIVVQRPENLAGIAHGVIAHYGCFGSRSGVIARGCARLAAVAVGNDPRGLTVPEVYLHRHSSEYAAAVAGFASDPKDFLDLQLRAFLAGAAEAEAIARLA